MTVAAVVRRDGDVLVVRERTSQGELWALPGGVVEPNELVHDAVMRELSEETGLLATEVGSVVFLSQHLSPPSSGFDPLTAFGFEIRSWTGDVRAGEHDEDVIEARFVPIAEAIQLLSKNTFRPSVEPAIAFLAGTAEAGTAWMWHVAEDWSVELKAVLQPV